MYFAAGTKHTNFEGFRGPNRKHAGQKLLTV
jgi:hypothetical protein